MKRTAITIVSLIVFAGSAAACGSDDPPDPQEITDIVIEVSRWCSEEQPFGDRWDTWGEVVTDLQDTLRPSGFERGLIEALIPEEFETFFNAFERFGQLVSAICSTTDESENNG